ncbi:protein lava lamp [Drosophila serrata]|uniref:protein lava lamp n=1 Tax=Drosophila serrata TaxID=7274 RepID=UPI000A1D03FD|nr:protein lava lamp [Drosophila serrata]
MAEDATSSATDAAAALETFYDFSIVQPHHHEHDGEADIHLTGSSNDLSTLQNVSAGTATTTRSKGRLDSLKENMFKQQERLTALKERARQSQDDRRRHYSMETSLGQTQLPSRPVDASTPLAASSKEKHTMASPDVSGFQNSSGNEKLLMLTQRTEQTRALIEQRKRDMAKSLLSVKTLGIGPRTNTGMGTGPELGSGSSMTDLRQVTATPVSRHRSALDLEAQGRHEPGALDENHVKMLKSRMKLTELKQSRQEQELQEQRAELTRRAHLIEQLELSGAELQRTLTQRNEELEQLRLNQEQKQPEQENTLQEQENSRLQAEVLVLRERLAELENINDLLETTRSELQEELSAARERERERDRERERERETQAEQVTTTDAQVSQELAKQLQELSHKQAELLAVNEELRQAAAAQQKLHISDASVVQRLEELEATIAAQTAKMAEQSEELAEKTTELNVLNVNLRLLEDKLAQSSRKSKPLFLDDPAEKMPEEELQQLKQKLDEANKANIKLKLKCKQAEKNLQKLQSEEGQQQLLRKLSAENEELQQRVTVLEDEKGQWQLASMDRSQQEELADLPNSSHLEAIRLLEEQKLELQQALEALQQGHESARVESELSEAQLEEQQLTQRVQQLESEAQEQRQQLETLQSEKQTLDKKLSHYISENMELLDKLEKLSSSSSAESIEIVERQQLEEQEQQQHPEEQDPAVPSQVSELTQTDQDDQETLSQLRKRLELFTQERGEVLDKLEHLSAENAQLQLRLDESSTSLQLLQRERDREREKDLLSSTSTSSNLSQELSSLQRSSEVVATLDAGDAGGPVLLDKCEKSLSKLNSELEAYRRANDRQAKFNVSKKLAKEAKNCHTQLSELLHKVKEASTAVETVTVVETVVAVTAPNGKALAEYEQLTAQNAELKAEISRLSRELEELRERESYPERESLMAIEASTMHQEEDFLHLQSLLEDSRNAQTEQQEEIRELRESQARLREEITQHQLQAVEASTMHQEEDFLHLQSLLEDSRNAQTEQQEEIRELRESQACLRNEITQHQQQAEQFDQQLNAKEMNHEKQLEQLTRLRRELESRNESLEGELSILQALVAEQKQQLIENLSESEHSLNLKMLELQAAQEELKELRELRRSQEQDPSPEQLREALRISKSLAAQQVSELGARQETIDALNQQIQELYQGLEQTRQEEQHKSRELREKLKKYALNLKKRAQENAELEEKVRELQEKQQEQEQQQQLKEPPVEVEQLQQQVSKLSKELKAKIHVNLENRDAMRNLQQQLQEQEQLLDQRQAELQEASLENKELRRERQEAEQEVFQMGQEVARLSAEVKSLQQQLTEQQPALEDLRRQLESKSIKFDKSKELIKHRNATIQSLQRELQQLRQSHPAAEQQLEQLRVEKDAEIAVLRQQTLDAAIPPTAATVSEEEHNQLRVQLTAAQEQHSLLDQLYTRDKANFEATISRLNTIHEGIQAKLQEDASYIESLEAQIAALQARSSVLEEQAASQAHHQAEADERVQSLQQELRERCEQAEQQLQLDQQLQQRLQELSQREEEQRHQLAEFGARAEESREQLASLRGEYGELQAKHAQLTAKAQAEREQLSHHSQEELADLQQQLAAKEAELQRQRQVYDAKLAAKTTELDEIECDLSMNAVRATNLLQQLERTEEQLAQRTEELQRQSEDMQELEREVNLLRLQQASSEQDVLELQELRMQAIQDKTEADHLRAQIDALCANHSQELQALQQQIAELDTLGQNQTDDQVYIETENKRLTEQLNELQAQLTRQLPLPAPSSLFFGNDAALAAPSPFDELVAQPLRVAPNQASPAMDAPPTIEALQRNVSDLEKHAQDLETKLLARNQSLAEQEERRMQLERRLNELELQIREKEDQERQAAVERLIQPAQAPPAVAPTLGMFFGETTTELGLPQTEPVEEPLIQPKKAYLCQPKPEQQQQAIDFSLDDDPWTEAAPLEPLQARIAQLEQQLATAEQQKTELQTKTAKLMKRLKEYKTKAATTPTPAPLALDNDLDTAIIEELKHQLQLHESRQAKAEEQLQQHLLEKEKLAKRIDVLTAGNERMAELKERQDMDVQMYQARIRELQAKVSQLDQWGEVTTTAESAPAPAADPASASVPIPASSSSIPSKELKNLQDENQELNAECQDLQERLKEERRLVLLAEETAAQSQAQWEQVQEQLRERELEILKQQQAQEVVQRELQDELSRLRNCLAEAQAEIEYLRSSKEQKDQQQDKQSSQSHQVEQEQMRSLQAEVERLRGLQSEVEHLRGLQTEVEQLRSLQSEVEHLRGLKAEVEHLRNLQGEVEHLRALKVQQESSQQGLQAELQQLQLQLAQLEAKLSRDQVELEALRHGAATMSHHEHDEQMAQLQEKESEIVHLKQRIEELMREDQTEKLVFEILTKNQELQMLRMQIKRLEEDREEEQSQPAPPAADTEQLLAQCQQLQQEKSDMEEELRVLNNHVLSSLELEDKMKQTLLQLDTKNIEITELRRSLEVMQQGTASQQQLPDLATINQRWEQVVEEKCSEVASIWQEHLVQREAAFKAQLEEISQQSQLQTPSQSQSQSSVEATATPQAGDDMMLKMQKALETQEMEIVTLKEQLAIRSAEYARLAAQYDPFRLQNRAGGGSGGNTAPSAQAGGPPSLSSGEPLPEYVLKADLDYALMMLHQRDMRVEEMILELVQLLEERDHLQLKLSDTLRQLETERSRVSDEASSGTPSQQSSAASSSGAETQQQSVAASAAGRSDLKQKLAELQTVKHSKDKAIVDEREQRLQQMLQLQKDMAKQATGAGAGPQQVPSQPPPTVGVDLIQPALRSPSMMLMDWILGSSSSNNNSEGESAAAQQD